MSPLDAKLAELRKRFDARAADELASINTALAERDRDAIVARTHKLAGIAGMFGHEEIGEAAQGLEQAALVGGDMETAAAPLRELLAKLAKS